MAVKTMTSKSLVSTEIDGPYIHDIKLTGVLLFGAEKLLNLFANLAFGHLDIILGGTIVGHEGQETIVSDVELLSCEQPLAHSYFLFLTNWYSRRMTLGTFMLWVDGQRSSNFLPVKISRAIKWTLA
jgi:hypothetical protein